MWNWRDFYKDKGYATSHREFSNNGKSGSGYGRVRRHVVYRVNDWVIGINMICTPDQLHSGIDEPIVPLHQHIRSVY
jgi:hypothetical protein